MKLLLTTAKGTLDITELVGTVTWAGAKGQCSRTLDFELLYAPNDPDIPKTDCPLGANVQLVNGGLVLFDGFVGTGTRNTDSSTIAVACFDRGLYLKRNHKAYKFVGASPEQIVRQLAGDFGFAVGDLPKTGAAAVTRNFLQPGISLYDILATTYTMASRQTGIPYHIGFEGDRLGGREIVRGEKSLIVQGGSNLIAASMTDSIEKMVNTVAILDEAGNQVRVLQDEEAVRLYGLFREQLKQSGTDNKLQEAGRMLEKNGVSQRITVDALGNPGSITGGTVVVREPYTGLYGLFAIEGDTHQWKKGLYYNKLTLSYRATMDEKEAGELPNAGGTVTADKEETAKAWRWVWEG